MEHFGPESNCQAFDNKKRRIYRTQKKRKEKNKKTTHLNVFQLITCIHFPPRWHPLLCMISLIRNNRWDSALTSTYDWGACTSYPSRQPPQRWDVVELLVVVAKRERKNTWNMSSVSPFWNQRNGNYKMVGRIVLGTLSSFGIFLPLYFLWSIWVFFFCESSFLSHHGSLENFFVFPTFLLDKDLCYHSKSWKNKKWFYSECSTKKSTF